MRRRVGIILGGSIVALGLMTWAFWPVATPDPVVRGRPLSAWLAEGQRQADGQLALTPEATEAVRSLGPDAVPTLLAIISREDPTIRRWSIHLGRLLHVPIGRTAIEANHRRAVVGFRALGPAVRPAWPALVALALRTSDDDQFRAAVDSLTGADIPTMRLLADGTKSPDRRVRSRAILAMQILRIAPGEVILPALEALKTDPDPTIQGHIGLALTDILSDLLQYGTLLRDRDPGRRAQGARLIGEFGTRAWKYLPDLKALADDPDPAVRAAVAEALGRIGDPPAPPTPGRFGLQPAAPPPVKPSPATQTSDEAIKAQQTTSVQQPTRP